MVFFAVCVVLLCCNYLCSGADTKSVYFPVFGSYTTAFSVFLPPSTPHRPPHIRGFPSHFRQRIRRFPHFRHKFRQSVFPRRFRSDSRRARRTASPARQALRLSENTGRRRRFRKFFTPRRGAFPPRRRPLPRAWPQWSAPSKYPAPSPGAPPRYGSPRGSSRPQIFCP